VFWGRGSSAPGGLGGVATVSAAGPKTDAGVGSDPFSFLEMLLIAVGPVVLVSKTSLDHLQVEQVPVDPDIDQFTSIFVEYALGLAGLDETWRPATSDRAWIVAARPEKWASVSRFPRWR